MIDYFVGTNHAYTLNAAEKEEIEEIFKRGGRYIGFGTISAGFIKVYDQKNEKPNKVIANLYGNIVNVLYILSEQKDPGFVEIFDLMQKYENERQVKIATSDLTLLQKEYEKGGRYVKRCFGRCAVLIFDKNKNLLNRLGGEPIYYTVLGLEKNYTEKFMEDGMLDLEKMTDYIYKYYHRK